MTTFIARFAKPATNIAMALIICFGLVIVLAQIKPFWTDEWRLVYNLKFKSAAALFGPLDFTQQFPRIYLVLLKAFTAPFDYSYFTLRLPAFLTSVCSIALAYKLMNKIYSPTEPNRYLFLLIIISSQTFLKYLVQIKQYEMEIFLSLVGIAQLIYLSEIAKDGLKNKRKYLVLCLSFLIAPFFSYTYPIVLIPVFLMLFIRGVNVLRSDRSHAGFKRLTLIWLPLIIGMMSIGLFYLIDVSQVLKDEQMYCFWQMKLLSGSNKGVGHIGLSVWDFFGSPGSGLVFQVIFSVTGIAAFFFAFAKGKRLFIMNGSISHTVHQYGVLLILIVFALFLSGKLPLGEARLNAFTFPAVALLIVSMLSGLQSRWGLKLSLGLSLLLYVGLLGNVVTTIGNTFTLNDYNKAVKIYSNTEDAIIYAQARKIPIVVTADVAYPYDILHDDACLQPLDAASVLKTFPAYKAQENIAVFTAQSLGGGLPDGVNMAQVGNGIDYQVVVKGAGVKRQ